MSDLKESRLMNAAEVSAKVSLSVTTIYVMMNKGKFPKPRRIGPKIRRWKESDISEWIESLEYADLKEWHNPADIRKARGKGTK